MNYKKICRSAGQELEDILDFANMVFSMNGDSIDFGAFYPKAYSDKRCGLVTHHVIEENGKIRALLDSYPIMMRLESEKLTDKLIELKAAYIGTVSVHPNTRNKGYLTELMRYAEEDALAQGYALMMLDGNRHRYQHYGYERAGIRYSFHVAFRNIRHCCAELYDAEYAEKPIYSFEEIDSAGSPYLDGMFELYNRQNMVARKRDDFWFCLQSGHAATFAVLRGERLAGYVSLNEGEQYVLEFEMDENAQIPKMIYDLMAGMDCAQLGIHVGMDECGKIEYLEKLCNNYNASMSHHIKILDYEAVLTFLFCWKQKYGRLVPNDYIVGVKKGKDSSVKNYLISVREDGTKVTRTDKKADAVFEELEFVTMLTTSLYFIEQQKGSESKIKNAPAGWFPLPFYLPDADAF
ncbi:MAG: GNAT family N-acetyltransferase [Lachnospiraceae bacterium]|nr:GNAT family N-acetyltransferase [Lachnospiraceae bacterium]